MNRLETLKKQYKDKIKNLSSKIDEKTKLIQKLIVEREILIEEKKQVIDEKIKNLRLSRIQIEKNDSVLEALRFISIEDNNGSNIWWPCLLFDKFNELLCNFEHNKKIYTKLVSCHKHIISKMNENEDQGRIVSHRNHRWVYLLGKERPCLPLLCLSEDEITHQITEFIENVTKFDNLYSKDHHSIMVDWHFAVQHGIDVLTSCCLSDLSEMPIHEDETFYERYTIMS